MPVIVGAPRSGTTLLRFMLDAHSALAIPPETGFLALGRALGDGPDPRQTFFQTVTRFPPDAPAWPDFGIAAAEFGAALDRLEPVSVSDGCRLFYCLYASRFGKHRWGDKTPTYCLHLSAVAELLPEAHAIHLIRDGRDVALSLRRMWFSPGDRIETLAEFWKTCVTSARRQRDACAGYMEVRFEDLVRDPEAELRRICRFVDLDFEPRMVEYHAGVPARLAEHLERRRTDGTVIVSREQRLGQQALTTSPPRPSRAGAWTGAMSGDEGSRFLAVAGDLLDELGYLTARDDIHGDRA
jgi:hypothetical protein